MCWVCVVIIGGKKIYLENIKCKYGEIDEFCFVEIFRKFMGFKSKVSV